MWRGWSGWEKVSWKATSEYFYHQPGEVIVKRKGLIIRGDFCPGEVWVGFILERKKRFDYFYQGRWPVIKKVSWEGRVTIFTGYRKKGLLRGRKKSVPCHGPGWYFLLIRKTATLQRCKVVLDRKKFLLMRCMSAKWGGCDSPPRFWLIWLK